MLHERNTIISLLVLMVTCFVDAAYYVSSKKEDFYTAMHECDKMGCELLDGQPKGPNLAAIMLREQLDAVWIAVTRKEVFWQWTDEEPYDGFNGEASNHQCALLKFNGEVVSSTCIAQQAGFVCQIGGHLSCPPKSTCLNMNGTKLFIDCSSSDWFASRYRCTRYQGDLLHLRDPSVTNEVAHLMEHQTKCQQVFIGLHKEKWLHVEPHSDGYVILRTHWDTGQPAFASGKNCVELLLNAKAEVLWRTQSCTHRNHFICSAGKALHPTETTIKKVEPSATHRELNDKARSAQATKHELRWLFLLFVVPAFAIGGILVCLLRSLRLKIHKIGRRTSAEVTNKVSKNSYAEITQEESNPLISSTVKDIKMSDSPCETIINLGVRPVTPSQEVSHKQISLPIRILILGNKNSENCKIKSIVQLWPEEAESKPAEGEPRLDDSLEAKLLLETYNHICGKITEKTKDISITFAAVHDDEIIPADCENVSSMLSEILKTFRDDHIGFHILFYSPSEQGFDFNTRRLLQELESKCITVTSDSSDVSAIRVLSCDKDSTLPSNKDVDFLVVPLPSTTSSPPWTGAVRATALIAHTLLTVFKNAENLSPNMVAKAQTSMGMKDMLKAIFKKNCTEAGPVLINPERYLSSETVDILRQYNSSYSETLGFQ